MEEDAPEFRKEPVNDIYQSNGPEDGNKTKTSELSLSTIKKNGTTDTVLTIDVNMVNAIDIKIDFPYPNNVDEVPIILIKNEQYFISNEEIKLYIENLENFEKDLQKKENQEKLRIISEINSKFNNCRSCKNEKNKYFCGECKENICGKCYNDLHDGHQLKKNLGEFDNQIENAIKELGEILFKGPKKDPPKEKSEKIYHLTDSQFAENVDKDFPNDKFKIPDYIEELIKRIISKNYTNYFHYKNILGNHEFIKNKYVNCFEKNCLVINYDEARIELGNEIRNEIRIFGDRFVQNNKDKLYLIINNKYEELTSTIEINEEYLEVILVQKYKDEEKKYITDLSYMFSGCNLLLGFNKFKGHETINLKHVENITSMFNKCTEIKELNLELLGDFKEVKIMENLFRGCEELTSIVGIENWDTSKVTSMNSMFKGCQKLINKDFLKKFNTLNVTDFTGMFSNCQSLVRIPEIKDWNMKNAIKLEGMFYGCTKLERLPDISGWDLGNAKFMNQMFYKCSDLSVMPEFDRLNLKNVDNFEEMFFGCISIIKVDISQWQINHQDAYQANMFQGCL